MRPVNVTVSSGAMLSTIKISLQPPVVQQLGHFHACHVDVLRLDQIHQEISGNKWFKLKYNLQAAVNGDFDTLLTFGGAHSNHIAATAEAACLAGIKAVGVIRGEIPEKESPTLSFARSRNMQLHFVSRKAYAGKEQPEFLAQLEKQYGKVYTIPEGGNNTEGIKGCKEIMKGHEDYDYVLCACGTGATFVGLCLAKNPKQVIVGVSVLKGEHRLPVELNALLKKLDPSRDFQLHGEEALLKDQITESCVLNRYAFSGYAAYHKPLHRFKTEFEGHYGITLDHVYTAKVFYALFDLLAGQKFRAGARILVLHTGGLQGNRAFEERYHLRPIR